MNTLFTGKEQIRLNTIASTNTYAMQLLQEKPAEGLLVLAERQSKGKGQSGNTWDSVPGLNLTFSLIFYPAFLESRALFYMSKMVSLSLARALDELLPDHNTQIKWPNDILADGKKIAGILLESQLEAKSVKAVVLGIGLNVNQREFPEGFRWEPTSMYSIARKEFDKEEVLNILLGHIEPAYLQLRNGAYDLIDAGYYSYLLGFGKKIRILHDGLQKEALVKGVERSGRLITEIDGLSYTFEIKDIRILPI